MDPENERQIAEALLDVVRELAELRKVLERTLTQIAVASPWAGR